MLRLDQINPPAGGNKFYKLQPYLAQRRPGQAVASFGGAWSNHIHALAAVGRQQGFATIGIIRGERPRQLSATLADAQDWGMELVFISRGEYRQRHDPQWLAGCQRQLGDCLLVPEGGAGAPGVRGCGAIARLIMEYAPSVGTVALACATGSTLAGIVSGLPADKQVLGMLVLKGIDAALKDSINDWLAPYDSHCAWQLCGDYHGGGYARCSPELTQFIIEFEQVQGIALEPVYTGKLMYGLYQLAGKGLLDPDRPLLAVHSGGLQGRRGFPELDEAGF